jgi:plasmid stabilization system protein ParE
VRVRILGAAERDLEDGFHFYERQSPDLGSYFLDSLVYFGGIHRVVFGHYRLLSKRFPFAIYYKIMEDTVVVAAVLDCRRNPSWIRERMTGD